MTISRRPNSDTNKMSKLLTLIDALLQKTTVYQMDCNVSLEAVKLAYDTINNEGWEHYENKRRISLAGGCRYPGKIWPEYGIYMRKPGL